MLSLTLRNYISTLLQSIEWGKSTTIHYIENKNKSITNPEKIMTICRCVPEGYAALVSSFVLRMVSTNVVISFIRWFLNICLYYPFTSGTITSEVYKFRHKNYTIYTMYIKKHYNKVKYVNIIVKVFLLKHHL